MEHWQRTEYPKQAEPGLGPNALARIRGSSHGPSRERGLHHLVTAKEGRFGADGAASVAVSRILPSLGTADVPLQLVPRGTVQLEMVGAHTPTCRPGRKTKAGGISKRACRNTNAGSRCQSGPVELHAAVGWGPRSAAPSSPHMALTHHAGAVPRAAGAPAGPADSGQCGV